MKCVHWPQKGNSISLWKWQKKVIWHDEITARFKLQSTKVQRKRLSLGWRAETIYSSPSQPWKFRCDGHILQINFSVDKKAHNSSFWREPFCWRFRGRRDNRGRRTKRWQEGICRNPQGRGSAKPFIALFSPRVCSCSKESIYLNSQRSDGAIISLFYLLPFPEVAGEAMGIKGHLQPHPSGWYPAFVVPTSPLQTHRGSPSSHNRKQ